MNSLYLFYVKLLIIFRFFFTVEPTRRKKKWRSHFSALPKALMPLSPTWPFFFSVSKGDRHSHLFDPAREIDFLIWVVTQANRTSLSYLNKWDQLNWTSARLVRTGGLLIFVWWKLRAKRRNDWTWENWNQSSLFFFYLTQGSKSAQVSCLLNMVVLWT